MPGTVISKHMGLGYAGKISRDADVVVFNRTIHEDSAEIPFGAPVCISPDNSYIGWSETSTDEIFAGIAVAGVKQATAYGENIVVYKPKQRCDVLARGTATVICSRGNPTAGGKVYLRILENDAFPAAKVGDWEALPDITPEDIGPPLVPEVVRTVELTGVKWTTGYKDANDVAEVTLLSRKNP